MIDKLVVTNLRRAQSFDRGLRTMAGVEHAIDDHIRAAVFTSDAAQRRRNLEKIRAKIINQVEREILPQARRIGDRNATDIARKLGRVRERLSPRDQQLSEVNLRRRVAQREAIIRQQLDASINRLDAKLNRFWTEPGEGSKANRRRRIEELFNRDERKRRDYEKALRAFNDGKTKQRPNKPKLDFASELASEIKTEVRAQARRTGTDAEISVFKSRGHALYIWVTPNGENACPDCKKRQSVVLTIDQWEREGRPGSGLTVCGDSCFCVLIPVESVDVSPSLITGVDSHDAGPMTTKEQMELFNKNRMRRPKN